MQTVERTGNSLASRISEMVAAGEVQLPPLPEVAIRAQKILSSDRLDMRELGEVLTGDAAIAAALLRLANSAHFGGLRQVTTVDAAVQRIGMGEVGAIVTGLSLKGHFDHPSEDKKEFLRVLWDHSITTAFAARAIAKELGVDAEQAFLGGLLHDCGKVLVLAAVDRLQADGVQFTATRELVLELMDELHCGIGYDLLISWNISEQLAEIARDHQVRTPDGSDLLLSVQAANLITRKLGFHITPDPYVHLTELPIIEDLGLEDMMLATLMIDMEDHLLEMKMLF